MNNNHLPLSTGMLWLRQACHILKKAPITVFGLVGIYLLLLLTANLPGELLGVPFLGVIVSSIVTPFGALAFAACGRELTCHRIPTIFSCYGEGLRNAEVRNKLIMLGLIYGACVLAISGIVDLLSASQIQQWTTKDGQLDPQSVLNHLPWLGFMVGAVLYAMLLGITCFSPMLIAWKNMPIGKAFFFSLVVCFRNLWPIVVLGLLLFMLASGGAVVFGSLGSLGQAFVVMWAMFVTSISYSSLYPMWRSIFEPTVPPLE